MAAKTFSDLNFMSLIVGGIESGITSGIGDVGLKVAEWGAAWVLNDVFGWQSPEVQNKEKLKDAIKGIESELSNIGNVVNYISQQITDLSNDIAQGFQKQLLNQIEQNVNNQIININTEFQELINLVKNHMQSTDSKASGDQTLGFASNVFNNAKIPQSVNIISSNLVGDMESDNTGLLDAWTNVLISELNRSANNSKATVLTYYQLLEQNYLSICQSYFQGCLLCAASAMRISLDTQLSKYPNPSEADKQQIEKAVKQAGVNWLTTSTAKQLSPVAALTQTAQVFVQCAHRLVLSQYMRPLANSTFAPMTTQQEAEQILGRANLVQWLINLPPKQKWPSAAPPNPGLIVNTYVRPSQLVDGKGPSIQPSPAYTAQAGIVFALSPQFANGWFKVIDFATADTDCTTILDYAASNVTICTYGDWTSPVPVVGPVATTGPFSTVKFALYDRLTLEPTQDAGADAILYAFAFDMSAITDNLVFNASSTSWSVSATGQLSSSAKDAKYTSVSNDSSDSGTTKQAAGSANATGQYKGDAYTYEVQLTRSLQYAGPTSSTFNVFVAAQLNLSGQSGTSAGTGGWTPVPWSGKASVSVGSNQIKQITVQSPSKLDKSNIGNASEDQSINAITAQSAGQGQDVSIKTECDLTIEHQSWHHQYGSSGTGVVNGCAKLTSVIFAWPQPVPATN